MQCRLRDQASQAFNVDFQPSRLLSPNLFIKLQIVDDGIPLFLATVHWEVMFLKLLGLFAYADVQKMVNLTSFLILQLSLYTLSWHSPVLN